MLAAVGEALDRDPAIDAVYSIGGGNTATLGLLRPRRQKRSGFLAHDLDGDNIALLRQGRLTAVLHHDLRSDMRQGLPAAAPGARRVAGRLSSRPSQIQVITPYNQPGASAGS